MTRYRKSIHQTLQEVAEWEAPKEPEVIVEEAPIPTETGRELLKKRIAHRKLESFCYRLKIDGCLQKRQRSWGYVIR